MCAESTCNVSGPVPLHTWSQLAVNEVPDKHAAAATLETIAHDPGTVGCSHCSALTLGQILCPVVIAEMMLVSGSCELRSACRFFRVYRLLAVVKPKCGQNMSTLFYDLAYSVFA